VGCGVGLVSEEVLRETDVLLDPGTVIPGTMPRSSLKLWPRDAGWAAQDTYGNP
jgi:hypothetical protein